MIVLLIKPVEQSAVSLIKIVMLGLEDSGAHKFQNQFAGLRKFRGFLRRFIYNDANRVNKFMNK